MRVASVRPRTVATVGPQPLLKPTFASLAALPADCFAPRFAANNEGNKPSWWSYILMAALGASTLVNATTFLHGYPPPPAPVAPAPLREPVVKMINEVDNRIGWEHLVKAIPEITPSTVFISGVGGSGSGLVIRANDGRLLVLTNAHVLEDKNKTMPEGAEYQIRLYNGSDTQVPFTFNAKLLKLADGSNACSPSNQKDIALLEIPANIILPRGVKSVTFRDVTQHPLQVGEPVLAVGAPYGYSDSITIGILSHLDRSYAVEPGNHFLQHSAPIGPGSSGGGLFVLRMENGRPIVELVGINTLNIRNAEGFGGAIPPDVIQSFLKTWKVLGN